MTQPPLANLLAVHDPDPAGLDEIRRDLQQGGEFACVWPPAPGWIAAAAPLPGGAPDDDLVRRQQFAFAEGRDLLVENSGQDPADALRRVAELADLHPDRLASLPGDFGFIRFRERGAATVVRSCGGLVPFYLWREGERCAIATRLGDLVRYLPVEFRLDPLVNAIWAASWGLFPEGRTFLAGVTLLERGHFARLDGQMRRQPYWQPRPQRLAHPTPAQAREHAERLRALLIAKLARDLDPAGGNLLTLSGGVDSSSLGALAAGVVGREVWSWSLLPSQERPDLVQHEMAFIEPLARRYGFTRRWAVHLHERLVLELWREASPIVFHILHPALCRPAGGGPRSAGAGVVWRRICRRGVRLGFYRARLGAPHLAGPAAAGCPNFAPPPARHIGSLGQILLLDLAARAGVAGVSARPAGAGPGRPKTAGSL